MSLRLTDLTPLIQVFDMARSVEFYRGKLGFEVVAASPEVDTPEGRFSHWTLLRLAGVDLMLNTAYDGGERPALPDPARIAAHRDTSLFIGCCDLDDVYIALKHAGLEIEPPAMAAYGLRRFSLRDPDNFELVFQEAP
jgi:catechol 2,3-dioxygenase-like lactoylglutathione lyase family enzyme